MNPIGVQDTNQRAAMPSFLLLIILAIVGAGCHDNPPVTYPTVAKLDESKLPLGPGDKVNLTVYYGAKSLTAPYTLDSTGLIDVQFIGSVTAGGKTLGDVRDEIKKRLADGYLKDPIVSLTLVELNSLTVSVSGMVAKTGSLKFTPGMSIIDVIALSGGFTPMARKNMVKVTRIVEGAQQTYKLPVEMMSEGERPTFPMMPGDEVFVPERPW
jgi:polysaccharide export outer membrane protein